jgi:hypothetical protein
MRREEDVLVQELPDETLVYDLKRNKAHCLNRTAALVWRHCDGRTTVGEIAEVLHKELNLPVNEQIVWQTLHRLQRADILSEFVPPAWKRDRIARRDWLRKLGVAAIFVPAVMTVFAPAASAAASCASTFPGCTGICSNGRGCRKTGNHCSCNG